MINREPMDKHDLDRLREAFDAARDPIPDRVKPEAIVKLLEQEKSPARLPVHKRRWFRVAVPLTACAAAVAVTLPLLWHHQIEPRYSGGIWTDTIQADNGECATGREPPATPPDADEETAPEAGTRGTSDRQETLNQPTDESAAPLLSASSLRELLSQGAVLLDLRDAKAYAAGHIVQAENLPLDRLTTEIQALAPEENTVILYGATAESCAAAVEELTSLGYQEVINLGDFTLSWTYPTQTEEAEFISRP